MNQKSTLVATLLSILFVLFSYGKNNGSLAPSTDGWKLVFEENFDGNSVNASDWAMYYSAGHAGNGLRRPEAFSITDGNLVVTAQMKDGVLVSGGMAHKVNYTYGKFEFRVRTEADPSAATSGVVLTWPRSEKWPIDGENDIYETLTASERAPFHTFIHYGADNRQYHYTHQGDAKEWHIIAMEWKKDSIKIYRDNELVYKLTDTNAIPHVPHHLCIQLDAFKKTMVGTVKMYVDWVKIYQEDATNELDEQKESSSSIKIFPNPVFNYLNIESVDSQYNCVVNIYSADNKLVKSLDTSSSKIDCSDLTEGLYFLKTRCGSKINICRFIKFN